ncbi:MAG: hypothetical protein ACM3VT_16675 [Solirubrobacterales bacterium]
MQLSLSQGDHCNPTVTIDSRGALYAAWQENERGVWSIRVSVSTDGIEWSEPFSVADSNDNQVNPALAAGALPSGLVALTWQSDAAGNQDIYVATSTDAFDTSEIVQVTNDPMDQIEPAVAVDAEDVVVILWTDLRNESSDIYGAVSTDGAWTNVPVVNTESNQSQVAVASGGDGLHLAWVDDIGGDTDVFYAASQGLPTSPLAGIDLIDDASAANQFNPSLAVTADANGTEVVFACWVDGRNGNADLCLAEVGDGSSRANTLVGGEGAESNQYEAALGVGASGDPYMVWTDDANGMRRVYCSASQAEPASSTDPRCELSAGQL